MSKKVLVISTSLRKGGNSDTLADEFIKGAKEAGNDVVKINLTDKSIAFCKGCLACQKTQKCIIDDDANEIARQTMTADIIAFATPVYFYGMSGQMKTLLDRLNPLYTADYSFREIYLLAAAAEDEETVVTGTVTGLNGWIACFEKARLSEAIFAGGVTDKGDITEHAALAKAYEAGKKV